MAVESNPLKDAIAAGATQFTPAAAAPVLQEKLEKQFNTESDTQPEPEEQEQQAVEDSPVENQANEQTSETGEEQQTEEKADAPDIGEIKSFADLKDLLELEDESVLTALTVPIGDEENAKDYSLAEMVERVQEYEEQKEVFSQEELRRAQEHHQQQEAIKEKLDSDILQLGFFTEKAMERVEQAMGGAEMAALRQSNPGEWVARQQELQHTRAELQQGYKTAHQEYQKQVDEQLKAYQQAEGKKIFAKFPDWGNGKQWNNHINTMRSLGFGDTEIQNAFDSRIVFAMAELHDAREELKTLRAEKAKGTVAAKAVKKEKPPLLRKRGADGRFVAESETTSRGQRGLNKQSIQKAMKQLQQRKDTQSAVEVVKQRLFAVK